MSETPDNVVQIADAVKRAKPVKRREKAAASPPAQVVQKQIGSVSGGGSSDIGGGFYGPPETLPDEAPVKALGKKDRTYYFLDSIGQLIGLKASEIGRNDIMGLFGGDNYLISTWPEFKPNGEQLKHKWQHQKLAPILINACTARGQWDPMDRVRGPGCWAEDDGALIMHCGDVLYVGKDRTGTGLRGTLLYPRGKRLPEPVFGAKAGAMGPGSALLDQAETWNWERGELDAKLFVGMIGCCILGAAADWRAQAWITGNAKCGKSKLQLLLRWTIGADAIIKAENATPAGVSQVVGYSSLPVSLDELEAKANDRQVQEVIELMRIAASGGEKLRGGADGTPTKTTLKNCFIASSVLIVALKPQDRSRMAILSLRPFDKSQIRRAAEEHVDADDDEIEEDAVLGRRERWAKIGCEIRGRLIEQWPRYRRTFRAYRRALIRAGHDARAGDQFGAIGAAYDLIMFNELTDAHSDAWAEMLPPATLAETAAQLSEERECLAHLLSSMPDIFRGGTKESVAYWLRTAREELFTGDKSEKGQEAQRTLAKIGIRIYRDSDSYKMFKLRVASGEKVPHSDVLTWIAISHTHGELAKIFHGTHWKGEAGAAGTWAQALNRLPNAVSGSKIRKRIDGTLHYVTCLSWETVFPPLEDGEDADVADVDQVKGG